MTDLVDNALEYAKSAGADEVINMAITAKELEIRGSFRFHEEFECVCGSLMGELSSKVC